ncbi:hypothetical protein HDU97_003592 [Phlyctochytrium planicorne]|nr:hypothetical protein HDU97_003592 [Phlyctochytrium planicorne]
MASNLDYEDQPNGRACLLKQQAQKVATDALLQAELFARKSNSKALAGATGSTFKTVFLSPMAVIGLSKQARKGHLTFWSLQDIHAELAKRNLKPLPKTNEEHILALALGQVVSIAAGDLVGDIVDGSGLGEFVVDGIVGVGGIAGHLIGEGANEGIKDSSNFDLKAKVSGKLAGDIAENAALASVDNAAADSKGKSKSTGKPPKPLRSPILSFIRKPDAGPEFATEHLHGLWKGFALRLEVSEVPFHEEVHADVEASKDAPTVFIESAKEDVQAVTSEASTKTGNGEKRQSITSSLSTSLTSLTEKLNLHRPPSPSSSPTPSPSSPTPSTPSTLATKLNGSLDAISAATSFVTGRRKSGDAGKKVTDSSSGKIMSAEGGKGFGEEAARKYGVQMDLRFLGGTVVGIGKVWGTVISGSVNPQGTQVTIIESDGFTEITYHGTIRGGVMKGDWETSRVFIEAGQEEEEMEDDYSDEEGTERKDLKKGTDTKNIGGKWKRGTFELRHL